MSHDQQAVPKPNILKSLIIAVIVLVVIVAIIMVLGMLGLPSWPFIFFLFYFTTIAGMAKEKLWTTAAGGLIGIIASFSQGLLTIAAGPF